MGLNPLKSPIPLISHLTASGDDDEPKEWESSGRLAAVWSRLTLYPFLTLAAVLFVGALALFLVPVLPTAHRDPRVPAAAGFLVYTAAVWVRARQSGVNQLQNYDLHIDFLGNAIVPRLGKRVDGADERSFGFKTLKEFKAGGVVTAYEQFRDRFARREIADHKEKHHRVDDDGSGAVIDGCLKSQSVQTNAMRNGIELFNTISVAHVGRRKDDLSSKQRDTEATLPQVIDTRTTSDVRAAFEAEKQARRETERLYQMTMDHIDELEEHVDPSGKSTLEATVQLIERLQQSQRRDHHENGDGTRQQGPPSVPPELPTERNAGGGS